MLCQTLGRSAVGRSSPGFLAPRVVRVDKIAVRSERATAGVGLCCNPLLPLRNVTTRSASSEAATTSEPPLKGVDIPKALGAIAVGLLIRFVVPIPAELTTQAWSLLAIFVSTIVGLVLEPLPVGAWAFLSLTTAVVTKTLAFPVAFAAFRNEVIWLIVVSFFFAKGFEKTGLGERIANLFVKAMGKSTLGLAYGLVLAEALVAPAMPSTSARAGGIFMPIIKSLSENAGSFPGETANKLGNYLVHTQMQASSFSSILFLTAAAQNLLCLDLAAQAGIIVGNPWVTWFIGAAPASIAGLLITPWLLYKLEPPEIKDTPEAPKQAAKRLEEMGPWTLSQKIMGSTLLFAVTLWVFGEAIGVSSVVAAMLGLCILLCTGVLEWMDCLKYTPAWDTLAWFAILVGMSQAMNDMGIIKYFSGVVGSTLTGLALPWPALFGLLHLGFFYLHYLFASQTAHVGALFAAFLGLMVSSGVPPVLAAVTLGYNVNMFGGITHYASGQAAIYYGSRYITLTGVMRIGFIIGLLEWFLFGTLGVLTWKWMGWIP